jgi:glycosyltransferase involved in cell wall biosynthesis
VSVSVLEALAHGCIPLLSDLPANRELVLPGADGALNGWVAQGAALPTTTDLRPLLDHAQSIAERNHAWVATQAMFGPCVTQFLDRLRELDVQAARR